MNKILLLISSRPEDEAFAAEVARASDLILEKTSDPVQGAEIINRSEPAVIFADVSTADQYAKLESAIQESFGLFSDKINANAIHFLSSENLERVPYLINSPLFGHFVLRNYQDVVEAGDHYGRIVKATLANRAFGLTHLMKPGTKIQVVKLQSSQQKQGAVDAVRNYLLTAGFKTRMATVVANAVDELVMNAIFDAPVDSLMRPIYSATARTTLLKLEGPSSVELHIGFDGQHVALTAVDLYGSLDKLKLLSHISKIYTDEEYKVKTSVAGAGIGLATVFRSGGSFFFVSEQRVRTEVTVFFRITDSFRDFKDQFRFISTQFYF